MSKAAANNGAGIHQVEPRETAGRDTIARYQAQFRAVAYECLSILAGNSIDRVYCDYHDDFVTRSQVTGEPIYHFYQVKTKGKRNHRWDKTHVFGLYKRKAPQPEKIAGSMAGKLLLHTIRFKNCCGSVVLLTNVHFDDDVENIAENLKGADFATKDIKDLIANFNEALVKDEPLDEEDIQRLLGKLQLVPGVTYLDPDDSDFHALAREAIYTYSEIDLQHTECEEIIHDLVGLVEAKSFTKLLSEMSEDELDDSVGIGIADLLKILSISKGAYDRLLQGGDPKAVKNASIIQRKLSDADATPEMIEFCSGAKVKWDIWYREKRHFLPEYDLNLLMQELSSINNMLARNQISFPHVDEQITKLMTALKGKQLHASLSKELLLGGVLAALVRGES
ncbi:MAG: dsDNA nuclease domain-containing protein [Pseudomonadota bacterium]